MKSRYLFLGITAAALFLSFRYLLPLILPFALAYIFAKILSPVINWTTQKLHWNKKVSSVLIVLLSVIAVGGFLVYTGLTLTTQLMYLLKKLPVYEQLFIREIEKICCQCDQMFDLAAGTSYYYAQSRTMELYENIGTDVIPRISGFIFHFLKRGAEIAAGTFIFLLSTLLILFDNTFPGIHRKFHGIVKKFKRAGFAYIKSQAIIIFIIAVVTSLGLCIIGNEYGVLFGVGIAVFDAFPVVGSGIILIPWCLIKIIGGDWFAAAVLITIFGIATFLREVMEPRLFAKDVGLKPLPVLVSVYVGIRLFNIGGILLGPIALTILKAVNEELKEGELSQAGQD